MIATDKSAIAESLDIACPHIGFSLEQRRQVADLILRFRLKNQMGEEASWYLRPDRRRRLHKVRSLLRSVRAEVASDPGLIPDFVSEWEAELRTIEALEMLSDVRILDAAILSIERVATRHENAPRPRNEFRDWFWERLATVYEEATGKRPTVTTDPIDGAISGPFVDLLQTAHSLSGDVEPPSPYAIERWVDRRRQRGRGAYPHPMDM